MVIEDDSGAAGGQNCGHPMILGCKISMTARVQQKEDTRRHLLIIELMVLLLMVIPLQPKMKRDRLPLLLLVICQIVPRFMMARKERNRLHLLLMQMSPVIHIVEMLSTKPPAQRGE